MCSDKWLYVRNSVASIKLKPRYSYKLAQYNDWGYIEMFALTNYAAVNNK